MLVRTTEGVLYTLRFGEIVYGRGEAIAVGDDTSDDAESGPGENRYVFITAEFDEAALPEPAASDTDAHESWARRVEEGRDKVERLATRFANWYYVVSAIATTPFTSRKRTSSRTRKRRRARGVGYLTSTASSPRSSTSRAILRSIMFDARGWRVSPCH